MVTVIDRWVSPCKRLLLGLWSLALVCPCFAESRFGVRGFAHTGAHHSAFSAYNPSTETPVRLLDDAALLEHAALRREHGNCGERHQLNRHWLEQSAENTASGAEALRKLLQQSALRYWHNLTGTDETTDSSQLTATEPGVSWSNYSIDLSEDEAHLTFTYHYQ